VHSGCSGCSQSGFWLHHGTTSAVEREPQTKIRSLALPGSFLACCLLLGRGGGPGVRDGSFYLAALPGARWSRPLYRRFTSPLTWGAGPSRT
jgi:hypothetical protein